QPLKHPKLAENAECSTSQKTHYKTPSAFVLAPYPGHADTLGLPSKQRSIQFLIAQPFYITRQPSLRSRFQGKHDLLPGTLKEHPP
ncbi:Os04g0378066, partial [Oryza sativa Japonica Group]